MKKFLLLVALFGINGAFLFSQTPMENQNSISSLSVMTYNIRYDNPGDGINRWDNRKERIASLLSYYEPDIIGFQEALKHQIQFLDSTLGSYSWVGVGRNDGHEDGEYSPVFYNKNKLQVIDWGTFWLSETPENPSKGWDAALPRICTWVKFLNKSDKSEIFFYNTHFDHRGEEARTRSSELIAKRIGALTDASSVILLGDFNQTIQSDGYTALREVLIDSYANCSRSYGPAATWSGFESGKDLGDRIDYIFFRGNLNCLRVRTITDNNGRFYPSDHLPVIAEFEIE